MCGGASSRRGALAAALTHLDQALAVNAGSLKARKLKAAVLRRQIRFDEAAELASFGAKVLHPNTIAPAVAKGIPLLAICRGMQVVNVALGGSLEQHMAEPHRHLVHHVEVQDSSALAAVVGTRPEVSCYHHQRVTELGTGLVAVAHARDGGVEAVDLPGAPGWFMGVQWHPEDLAADDARQQGLFDALLTAARRPAP